MQLIVMASLKTLLAISSSLVAWSCVVQQFVKESI